MGVNKTLAQTAGWPAAAWAAVDGARQLDLAVRDLDLPQAAQSDYSCVVVQATTVCESYMRWRFSHINAMWHLHDLV